MISSYRNRKATTIWTGARCTLGPGRLRRFRYFLAPGLWLATLLLIGACAPPPRARLQPASASPIAPLETAAPAVVHADLVITLAAQEQTTTVKVGQVINVSDFPNFEWSLSYRPNVLLMLTATEKIKQPGADGWFFRAIAPGATEIVLQSLAASCPAGTPCPPNVIRYKFPIQAVP